MDLIEKSYEEIRGSLKMMDTLIRYSFHRIFRKEPQLLASKAPEGYEFRDSWVDFIKVFENSVIEDEYRFKYNYHDSPRESFKVLDKNLKRLNAIREMVFDITTTMDLVSTFSESELKEKKVEHYVILMDTLNALTHLKAMFEKI